MDEWEFIETLCFEVGAANSTIKMTTKVHDAKWIITVSPRSVILQLNESETYIAEMNITVNDTYRRAVNSLQEKVYKHLFQGHEKMTFITGSLSRTRLEIRFYARKGKILTGSITSNTRELPNSAHGSSSTANCSTVSSVHRKKIPASQASTTANSEGFSSDLNSLLQTGLFSDVQLHCDDESDDGDTGGSEVFKAHKAILAARSPVFAAMLQCSMKEAKDNVIDVKNCKPVVLQTVLEYIYSGKIQQINDWCTACDILSVADLYQIPGLKTICSEYLCSAVAENNALSLLEYGDLYDTDLKENLLRFVCDKFDALKITKEWDKLSKEKPSLAMDVMSAKIQCLSRA